MRKAAVSTPLKETQLSAFAIVFPICDRRLSWLGPTHLPGTTLFCLKNVATPGTAESFLCVTHVTRTRRAHQITASSLYHLLQKAYLAYCSSLWEERNQSLLEDWCPSRAELYQQFKFWLLILQLELAVLIYVRAIREGDFILYVDALTKIAPWFFANYARWIPVERHGYTERRSSQGFHRVSNVAVISLYVVVYLCDCWYVWRNKSSSTRETTACSFICCTNWTRIHLPPSWTKQTLQHISWHLETAKICVFYTIKNTF